MVRETNFGDIPQAFSTLEKAAVVVIPVPYDATSTWIKGADKGPAAIIEASANMELYDIETDAEVYMKGIFTAKAVTEASSPEAMVEAVKKSVASYLDKQKFCVLLGGEHSVTIGSVEAYHERFKNLSVLQLDAHSDLRPEYQDSKFSHACVMSRVKERVPAVQVGIRSMDVGERPFIDKENVFFAEDICGKTGWMEKAVAKLSQDVYITIDLDVFDPAIMPSTGTPEPGGMLWYETVEFLRKVVSSRNVVGFDVVELCPNENNKAPDFLAAKLIYKLLSYKFRD